LQKIIVIKLKKPEITVQFLSLYTRRNSTLKIYEHNTHSQINGTNSEIAVSRIFRANTVVKILYYRIFLRSPSRAQSEKSEI
jgi:hypothetical protein